MSPNVILSYYIYFVGASRASHQLKRQLNAIDSVLILRSMDIHQFFAPQGFLVPLMKEEPHPWTNILIIADVALTGAYGYTPSR